MEIFAERLKQLRNDSGLSQREIADYLHIKQQSYLRYELGTGEPSLEVLVQLAKKFEVATDYLLGLEDLK